MIEGRAEFIDNHTLRVFQADGERVLRGEKIFINTGAESVIPAITGLTTTAGVFDSTGLLSLSQRPARLGILGGGYIGLEFASMFANFGTKVTIFEAAPQFLPREDRDIAQAITRILQEKGVELILKRQRTGRILKGGRGTSRNAGRRASCGCPAGGVGAKTGDGWLTVAERRRGGERTRRDHRG